MITTVSTAVPYGNRKSFSRYNSYIIFPPKGTAASTPGSISTTTSSTPDTYSVNSSYTRRNYKTIGLGNRR